MNRTQRLKVARKRRLTFAHAVAAVLTVGVVSVLVYSALQQRTWSLGWLGCWAFAGHQLVMLAIHVCGVLRSHREHEDLIRKYSEDGQGRRHVT